MTVFKTTRLRDFAPDIRVIDLSMSSFYSFFFFKDSTAFQIYCWDYLALGRRFRERRNLITVRLAIFRNLQHLLLIECISFNIRRSRAIDENFIS